MLQKIRWFLLIVGVLVVVTIALQNDDPVPLKLLLFSRELPLTVLLLATSAASFVFGALMTAWMLRAKAKRNASKSTPAPASEPAQAPSSSPFKR